MANKALSHAEVWDDSALINVWDSALQEYKKYHSIKASGGNVPPTKQPDVQMGDQSQPDEDAVLSSETPATRTSDEAVLASSRTSSRKQEEPDFLHSHPTAKPEPDTTELAQATSGTTATPGHPPQLPPSILAGGDEALRNLMTSWYFAGYYTGLYEGRQQQQRRQQQKDSE